MSAQQPDVCNAGEAEMLRLLADHATEYAVFVVDGQGRVQHWGPGAERLLGYRPDEVIGRPADCFSLPDDVPPDAPRREREPERTAGRGDARQWHVRKDGTRFRASVLTKPLREADGTLRGFATILRELPEVPVDGEPRESCPPSRNAAAHAQALQESEARYRALIEQAPFSIQIFSPDGRTQQVNRAWETLWGATLEDVAEYNILQDRQLEARGVLQYIHRAFAGEPVVIPEIPYDPNKTLPGTSRHPDPVRWTSAVAYPLKDPAGQIRQVVLLHHDMTARRRAEDALRENQRLLQNILDNAPALVYVKDREGRLLHCNRRFAEIAGRPARAIIGKTDREIFGDALDDVLEHDRRVFQAGRVMQFEERLRLAGQLATYLSVKAPVKLSDHGDTVLVGITTDVTEWKRAEQELRDREATLQAYYTNAPLLMGVVETSEEDILHIYDNPATCRFFGLPESGSPGRWASELGVPPRTVRHWLEHYRESARREAPVRFEYRHPTPGGDRWLSVTVTWIAHGASGRPRFCYLAEDVTDQRTAVDALLDSEERFRGIVSQSIAGVAEVDPTGRFLFANQRYCEIVGRPSEELLRLRMQEISHPEDLKKNLPMFERLGEGGPPYIIEKRYLRPDGSQVWVNNSVSPLLGKDGRVRSIVAVSVDVTDRRRAEEGLREADRRKDEFLAMLGHELRNPLAPIRSALEILGMEHPGSELVDMMKDQVDHLVRLVDDLLDVSRIMRGKIELRKHPVELTTVVAKAVETARPLIDRHHHQFDCALPREPVWLDADAVRLTQVFANLLNNAAKYSRPGGRIHVAADHDGGTVRVRVRDEGIGIDPALLPAIFDLFTQGVQSTDRSDGGLGIGLTVVKNLVEMHEGTVSVQSGGPDAGSEFIVQLPVLRHHRPRPADRPTQSSGPGFRILAVDDNRAAAKMLELLLSKLGPHEIHLAHDGPSALQCVDRVRPQIVLLDIGLPGISGLEVASRIRAEPDNADVLLVALTGYGTAEDVQQSQAAGFDEHLVKPTPLEALRQLLQHPKLA